MGGNYVWSAISAGDGHTLALRADKSLWAWGCNWYGELGNGTTDDAHLPVQIGSDTNWSAISAGDNHNIATKTDGTLWTWGYNYDGELGNGTTDDAWSPIQISGNTWKAVSAGSLHSIASKTDGSLWAWGANQSGQLGDGTTTDRHSPVLINFQTYTITATAGSGGSMSPMGAVPVSYGASQTFVITPNTGYHITSVSGCGGTLSGNTYTTGAITANCTVTAGFAINTYTLTISKTGAGIGIVTSASSGISCGSDCSEAYTYGTVITLTPSPSSDSSFAGWSGGGCSGVGNCPVTLNSDTTVTATFNVLPPVGDFTSSSTSGYAPPSFTVNFTDTSANSPTSWIWNFGDGATSALRNPSHDYSSAGTYSVSLTVTNASGTNTVTKNSYITVQQCPNQPVRILRGGTPVYYTNTINDGYGHAVNGDIIQSQAVTFTENLTANRDISVTIDGGYSCDYSSNPETTLLKGALTINSGTVTIKNFNLQF